MNEKYTTSNRMIYKAKKLFATQTFLFNWSAEKIYSAFFQLFAHSKWIVESIRENSESKLWEKMRINRVIQKSSLSRALLIEEFCYWKSSKFNDKIFSILNSKIIFLKSVNEEDTVHEIYHRGIWLKPHARVFTFKSFLTFSFLFLIFHEWVRKGRKIIHAVLLCY